MNPCVVLTPNHAQDAADRMIKAADTSRELKGPRCWGLGRIAHDGASRSNDPKLSHADGQVAPQTR